MLGKVRGRTQQKKPRISAGRIIAVELLLTGAFQARSLRASESAVGHLQRTRQGPGSSGLEDYADLTTARGGQARRAGCGRDTEIPGRRDRDAGQRYALLVSKRKNLGCAGRPHLLRRVGCTGGG